MRETLPAPDAGGLERSCSPQPISVRLGAGARGLDRAEIHLSEWAYQPHQHDTYAIGITVSGVQAFRYRGQRWVCLPGQLHILHPGETHDGAAVTGHALGYRILYLAPELIRSALGGRPLPFVADPVQALTPASRRMAASWQTSMSRSVTCSASTSQSQSPTPSACSAAGIARAAS